MMAPATFLETFSSGAVDTLGFDPTAQLTASYEEGFAAGLTAAEEDFSTRQNALTQEVVQVLRDSLSDVAAIRAQLLASVGPLHDAIMSAVLPAMIAPAFYAQVRALIAQAANEDLAAPLTVFVPSGQSAHLTGIMSDAGIPDIEVVEDGALDRHAVRLAMAHQETALDLDAAMAAIAAEMAALDDLITTTHEVSTYG